MRANKSTVWSTLFLFLLLSGLAPAFPAQAATVQTDQPEYAIGDFATITGQDFLAGETVTIEVQRVDNVVDRTVLTAQPDGTFQYVYYLNPNLPDPDAAFRGTLTVRALVNSVVVASTTFLDNPQWTLQGCSKEKGLCVEKSSGSDWSKSDGDDSHMEGWTSGALKGWYEGENVPYRLRVSLPSNSDGNKNYYATTEHDNLKTGVTGIDAMSGFYVGAGPSSNLPEGFLTKSCSQRAGGTGILTPTSGTPCYVSGPTYSGQDDDGDGLTDEDVADGLDNDSDGRVDEDPPKNASGTVKMIQYVWAVHFNSDEAGNSKKRWAFYWYAHLANGSSTFPGGSLHADASPSGNQDVPILQSNACNSADLSVTKTDAVDPVSAGGTISYTIKVKNWGTNSAGGVTMYDTLPSGVVFVSASGSGWTCSYASGPHAVTCTRSTSLGSGNSASDITLVVTAPSPGVQTTITNMAEVFWSGSDPASANNVAYQTTTVQAVASPLADLSITKTGPPDPGVTAGGTINYTITVTNNGPGQASGISVTDTLPTGTTFISASGSGWTCTQSLGVVTCTRSTLNNGSSSTITIVVTAPTPSFAISLTNKAKVTSTGCNDTNTSNNSAVAETIVSGIAELSIVKTESVDPVLVNGTLTYTLTVTNAGPSSASGVSVSDLLPAGVTFVSASGSGWTCGYSGGTVTCFRASLLVGTGPVITIVVTAPSTPPASPLSNTASVTAFELDTVSSNNSSTITTTVSPAVDLSIGKTGPASVTAGGGMTYAVSVSNAGPSGATGITVTDVLPAGTTYGTASGTGWTCTHVTGTVTCTRASLAMGPAPSITITLTAPVEGGSISNTVSISANETDTNTGDNVATAVTTVNASSDLSISKSGPVSVTAGQSLTYVVTVTNIGPSTATGVSVTDTIPSGTTLVSAIGTGWTCTGTTTVTCTSTSLVVGTANPINITVTAPGSGPLTNTAGVTSTSVDPSLANNTSNTVSTSVTPSSDLAISKTGPASVTAGQSLTYVLTVTNNGPSTATGVSVSDTIPAGSTFVSAAGTGWSCSGTSTVTCTMASLTLGTANAINITVTAPSAGGGISNTASVSSTTGDPNSGNNSSTANTSVTSSSDLSISKTGPATVTAGQNLTYTVTVTNGGPSTASNVTVTDSIPTGTTWVSAAGTGWTCTGTATVNCSMASLAVGTANPISITVTAPASGSLSNTAGVSSSTGDPNTANNTSSPVITTVIASSDLSIVKTGPATATGGQNVTYTVTVSNAGPSTATGISMTDTIPAGTTFVSASGTGWVCGQSAGLVTCTLSSLAVGPANPISIIVTTPSASGTISNTAGVSATTGDPNLGNNTSAAVITTINPASADLAIAKNGPTSVTAGGSVTYTLSVTNYGPSATSNVTATDTLPAGVTFVSASGTSWTCTQSLGVVTCSLASLAASTQANSITVVVTAPTAGGGINNTATVSSSTTTDPVTGNNNASFGTIVTASADLSITKSGPATVTAGQNLTYVLTVSNTGPSSASNVTVSDTIPAGTTFVSASGTGWTCTGTATVSCNRASLAVGTASPISITVTAPSVAGSISNTGSVSSNTGDPNTANNTSAAVVTTVSSTPVTADLSITKTDSPDPVGVGLDITYTITVTNNGPNPASGVVVTDTLGTGLTLVSFSPTTICSAVSLTITCNVGNLANGASYVITVVAGTSVAGMVSNTASVTGNEADSNLADNTASATTNVGDVSRLINISTRATVGTAAYREIGGFIIGGNLPKSFLIRGFGPSMANLYPGTLTDPQIEVLNSSGVIIATNNDWQNQTGTCTGADPAVSCGTSTDITATGLDPCTAAAPQTVTQSGCIRESSVLITMPPGAYTARLSGVNGGTGIGRIGINDVDGSTLPKLVNISTRAQVLTGANAMIGGFIVGSGTANKKILLRGLGPSMVGKVTGTLLSDPKITLVKLGATNITIASNDNWQDQTATMAQCALSGFVCEDATAIMATSLDPCTAAAPLTSTESGCAVESAILVTVPPGSYTVRVEGAALQTGIGRVGINDVDP